MFCDRCMGPLAPDGVHCLKCGYTKGSCVPKPTQLFPGGMLERRYYVGNVIGQGGFGITYVAFDTRLEKKVAIKEYFPNGYTTRNTAISCELMTFGEENNRFVRNGIDKFLSEARLMAQFDQTPGIVKVNDFFESNKTAYIVMEYLEGITLKEALKQRVFSADRLFVMMLPLFYALRKVHEAGIIHRDISPDNIMFDPKNNTMKLMDFGASRHMNFDDEKTLSIILKKGYAPAEQHTSKGKQGAWTDIYALCATLYKCMTGVTPEDSLDRTISDEIKWPSEMGIGIDPVFEELLKKGMAIRVEDRIQTMSELIEGVENRLKENPMIDEPEEEEMVTEYVPTVEQPSFSTPHVQTSQPMGAPGMQMSQPMGTPGMQTSQPMGAPGMQMSQPMGTPGMQGPQPMGGPQPRGMAPQAMSQNMQQAPVSANGMYQLEQPKKEQKLRKVFVGIGIAIIVIAVMYMFFGL